MLSISISIIISTLSGFKNKIFVMHNENYKSDNYITHYFTSLVYGKA
jgi:hypothetical protein